MSQSVTHYVNVSVSLEGTGPQPAGFGVPLFLFESSVSSSSRLHGPFTSAADVLDFGYVSGSPPHLFAQAVMAQQPRVSRFYIGRADSGDADISDSLDAVLAANPGAWYAAMMESRDDADIALLAAWIETVRKIAIAQSNVASLPSGTGREYSATFGGTPTDGNYSLVFTGYGLVSPATVTQARAAASPATSGDLAIAFAAELETQAGAAGDVEDVVDPDSIEVDGATVTFRTIDGINSGTLSTAAPGGATLTAATLDADIGHTLFDANYTRTALLYYPTDTVHCDAAWASRCLSFDLDQKKGAWAFKRLNGIEGTNLTNAQVAALRAVNANYFAPAVMSAGNAVQAFTAQGWMPSGDAGAGRRIDVTTSLDWAHARLEEALLGVLLRETHTVGFDDAGINRFAAAAMGVIGDRGVRAGHFVPFVPPEGDPDEGEQTPLIRVPSFRETLAIERTNRELSMSGVAYLKSSIERVVFNMTVRQ